MRVPACLIAVPLLAGTAAGVLAPVAAGNEVSACAAGAVLCLLAGALLRADGEPAGVALCVIAGAALAGASMGLSSVRRLTNPPLLAWFEALPVDAAVPVRVEGRLRDDAAVVEYGVLLTLDVDCAASGRTRCARVRGGARLVVSGGAAAASAGSWRAGRRIRTPALLRRPAWFANPGVPDERRALALRGVVLTGTIKSAALVETVGRGRWWSEAAAEARARVRATLRRHVAPIDTRSAAVAIAILIGDRTGLPAEDERRLQDAGTYHVIAISGGNIAILTGLCLFAGRILGAPGRTTALLAIGVLLAYGQIAGGASSVGRAITAAVVLLAARVLDHRGPPLNVLAVAACLAVAAAPAAIVDAGFLLSFGATAGILLGVPALLRIPPAASSRVVRAAATGVAGMLAATLCAEAALAPIGASLFGRVTFAGLALNLPAIPLMTVVQCAAMAVLGSSLVSTGLADALAWLVAWSARWLVDSSALVEHVPWAVRDVAPPAAWLCIAYYGACAAALMQGRIRRIGLIVLPASAAVLLAGPPAAVRGGVAAPAPAVLRIVVFDVGQGDATLVALPDGRGVLVDAGGLAGTAFDIGGRVIVPALRALGVSRLHALVITHGDPDHLGGAATVLRRLPVASVWEGVPVSPHGPLRELVAQATAQRVPWRTLMPGDVERAGDVAIHVVHPPAPDWERQRVRNDDSVVLDVRYGQVSILLPGDIGSGVERSVLERLQPAPLVVLKAAHHGSATSSSEVLLDTLAPRAAIFSAGRNNRYGHPAPVVVERLARRGIPSFNTAEEGAVFVESDGRVVEIIGWRSGRRLRLE